MPKVTSPSKLVDELEHNASASGNKVLERRLADLAIWFYQNKTRIAPSNLQARVEFLEKAFWIQAEVIALTTERIREAEGGHKNLWLPHGLDVRGDVRRFE
jgi:hypothetical protein